MKINEVIIKPVLTEKSTELIKKGFYLFEVNLKANKNKIKEAIEKIYSVKVEEIKILIRKGKLKKSGKKMKIKKLSSKKLAFIKLKKGKIESFPNS